MKINLYFYHFYIEKGYSRSDMITLSTTEAAVKVGESVDVTATLELSEKIKAAGGVESTYKLYAESSEPSVTATVDGKKISVKGVSVSATPATVTVYAAQANGMAIKSAKYQAKSATFTVKVKGNLEAKQSGANKITVMGSDLVASKSAYVVKNANGGVLEIKADAMLNADKTEAVLETVTGQIPEGKYTLTYKDMEPVSFEIAKVVVKSIEITPSGTAIMSSDGKKAYAYYRVLDQFGNNVTKSPVVNLRVNGSDNVVDSRGMLTFTAKDAVKGYTLNWDKISVSIVDVNSGVAANALLTVGEKAKIVDAKYEKIYNVSKREIVESITDGDKLANFKLLFTAVDQYGNNYVVDGGGKELVVNLLGTTGVTVDSNNVSVVEYKDKKYYAYQLKNIADTTSKTVENPSRPGEVTIQAISVNNGKTVSEKFNVVASSKVDTLKVWEGNDGIYNGKVNELGFAAYDAEGKEITSWDSLKALNDKPFNTDKDRFYFKRKDNGKVGLYYDLSGTKALSSLTGSNSLPVPTIFRTMTDKFSNVTLNVKAQKYPVAIVGLKSDFAKGVVAGRALPIKAKNFRFQDQFGNLMEAKEISTGYKVDVTVKVPNGAKRAFDYTGTDEKTPGTAYTLATDNMAGNTDAHAVSIANEDATIVNLVATTAVPGANETNDVAADVTVQLRGTDGKTAGEARKFTVYAVDLAKMNSFDVKVPALVPSADVKDIDGVNNELAKKGFEVKAVGHYAGETIELTNGTDFTVLGANSHDAKNANVPSLENEKTVVKRTAEVEVAIADGKGTHVKKEYTYTNERRVVKTAKVKTSPVTAAFATSKGWADIKTSFEIKDQYDVVVDAIPYITVSDLVAGIELDPPTANGTSDVKIKMTAGANQERKVTLKLTFNGSGYVFDQVVTFKTTD